MESLVRSIFRLIMEISNPIETPDGYHIRKILEGVKITRKNFGEVKDEIQIFLLGIAQDNKRKCLLESVTIDVV